MKKRGGDNDLITSDLGEVQNNEVSATSSDYDSLDNTP
jgi:hypothetical protein